MSERFRPVETLKGAAYAVRLLGAEALAAIDRRLDWVPDDAVEDARIKSDIWKTPYKVEAPVPREEDLDGS